MDGKSMKSALRRESPSQKVLFGSLVSSANTHMVQALAAAGSDVCFIDTEHIALDRQSVALICTMFKGLGVGTIVRVVEPEPYRVCQMLDAGAMGVVAPYVETLDQVLALIGATKLRPLKGEKLAACLEAIRADPDGPLPVSDDIAEYMATKREPVSLLINIESLAGITAMPDMLRLNKWIDGVLIGPHDLSVQVGRPRGWHSEEFHKAIDRIVALSVEAGVGVGVHYSFDKSVEYQAKWVDAGANLVIHKSDIVAVRDVMSAEFAAIKAAVATTSTEEAGDGAGAGAAPPSVATVTTI